MVYREGHGGGEGGRIDRRKGVEGAGGGFGLLSCLYRGVPGGFLFSSVHDDDGVYTPACMVKQFQAEIFRTVIGL